MRSISKQCDDVGYLPLQGRQSPQTSVQATKAWKNFSGNKSVLNALLREQYRLCCYSELRADELGLGYHIEHIENKSQNPQRTFDCNNLAASAIKDDGVLKKQGYEVFGGHAAGKKEACDMSRFISPHREYCNRYFAYLSDGRVVPSADLTENEKDRAQYTIDLINLNSPYLIVQRRDWWEELENLLEKSIDGNESLEELALIRLMPTNNALSHFFTLTRQFFGQIAEQTLQNHAPQLV